MCVVSFSNNCWRPPLNRMQTRGEMSNNKILCQIDVRSFSFQKQAPTLVDSDMWRSRLSAILLTFSREGHTSYLFCRMCSKMQLLQMFLIVFGFKIPRSGTTPGIWYGPLTPPTHPPPDLLPLTSFSWPPPHPDLLLASSWPPPPPPPDQARPAKSRPFLNLWTRPCHASRLKGGGGQYELCQNTLF